MDCAVKVVPTAEKERRRGRNLRWPIEVPLANHPIPQVAEALAQSLAALIRGEWEEAVADCRPGLKALAAVGDAKYKLQLWSRDAGKDERFWRAVQGLLSVTHAAYHPESAKDAATADDAARPATRIQALDVTSVVTPAATACAALISAMRASLRKPPDCFGITRQPVTWVIRVGRQRRADDVEHPWMHSAIQREQAAS